jgi:hypothetical protein
MLIDRIGDYDQSSLVVDLFQQNSAMDKNLIPLLTRSLVSVKLSRRPKSIQRNCAQTLHQGRT